MQFLLGFCQLALVSGLMANAYTNALIGNAFGGGLQGAIIADQLGFGNTFDVYVGEGALSNPMTNNAFLYSSFFPNNGFTPVVNTYLGANALSMNPNNFLLAGALGGASSFDLYNPYFANAFGGGLSGAYFANTFFPPGSFGGGARGWWW
jgi:hypothetical protein